MKYPKWPVYSTNVQTTELLNLTKNEIVLPPPSKLPFRKVLKSVQQDFWCRWSEILSGLNTSVALVNFKEKIIENIFIPKKIHFIWFTSSLFLINIGIRTRINVTISVTEHRQYDVFVSLWKCKSVAYRGTLWVLSRSQNFGNAPCSRHGKAELSIIICIQRPGEKCIIQVPWRFAPGLIMILWDMYCLLHLWFKR